jgi:hypothetical protein
MNDVVERGIAGEMIVGEGGTTNKMYMYMDYAFARRDVMMKPLCLGPSRGAEAQQLPSNCTTLGILLRIF